MIMGKNRTKKDESKKYVPPPFQSKSGKIGKDGQDVSWTIDNNKSSGRIDLKIDNQLIFSFIDPAIVVAKAEMLDICTGESPKVIDGVPEKIM
jgi:hypothetical protein